MCHHHWSPMDRFLPGNHSSRQSVQCESLSSAMLRNVRPSNDKGDQCVDQHSKISSFRDSVRKKVASEDSCALPKVDGENDIAYMEGNIGGLAQAVGENAAIAQPSSLSTSTSAEVQPFEYSPSTSGETSTSGEAYFDKPGSSSRSSSNSSSQGSMDSFAFARGTSACPTAVAEYNDELHQKTVTHRSENRDEQQLSMVKSFYYNETDAGFGAGLGAARYEVDCDEFWPQSDDRFHRLSCDIMDLYTPPDVLSSGGGRHRLPSDDSSCLGAAFGVQLLGDRSQATVQQNSRQPVRSKRMHRKAFPSSTPVDLSAPADTPPLFEPEESQPCLRHVSARRSGSTDLGVQSRSVVGSERFVDAAEVPDADVADDEWAGTGYQLSLRGMERSRVRNAGRSTRARATSLPPELTSSFVRDAEAACDDDLMEAARMRIRRAAWGIVEAHQVMDFLNLVEEAKEAPAVVEDASEASTELPTPFSSFTGVRRSQRSQSQNSAEGPLEPTTEISQQSLSAAYGVACSWSRAIWPRSRISLSA
eukprot:TRINITY_DN13551_c0_g1_i1.p1 TRINITY_DN13551_c0_g1~~TRINITY_DN13551_c0_g1_i1.p1  ORF type:complete len:533 (-),score=62.34 TRINITY_DN13551_c0_g1_i1:1341-2939(-)